MKRKRSKGREAIQFRPGEPLKYGSTWKVPRAQERVPRSLQRSLMSRSKLARLSLVSPAKQVLQVHVPRKRVLRTTPRTGKVVSAFRFRSPFFSQYRQMVGLGRMVRNPKRVLFCVKRKIRREVLFAFRRAGFRGSGPGRRRTYRRNGNSSHGC